VLERPRRPVSPTTFRRIAAASLVLLVLIVVTGAAVRLTGSGLGCTDWPRCTDRQFVAPDDLHARIEFGNRLLTGVVSVSVALAVTGSLRRAPRRRDLVLLSAGLVAGVIGQIVLGGLVVLSHLNPWLVQGHFVLSMLLVLDAAVLAHRAAIPDDATMRPVVTPTVERVGRALAGFGAVVLLTGTLVTGSGPHSGSKEVEEGASRADALDAVREIRRLPLAVHDAARIHGVAVWLFLAGATWLLVRLRRDGAPEALARAATWLVTAIVLQGALGYTQYATGVPPLLVGLHVLGASLVWVAVLRVALAMRAPAVVAGTDRGPDSGGGFRPHRDADRDLLAGG